MKRILAILLLVLTSCSFETTKSPEDNSFFANSNCTLPCWYGITIGKTTEQEAIEILREISFVNQDSIMTIKSTGFFDETIHFTMGKGPQFIETQGGGAIRIDYVCGGKIFILNDRVSQIVFGGDMGLTIQQVVDIFGMPGYAIPFTSPGGYLQVELLNPAQGIDFGYGTNDFDSEITPDTKISELKLFDATMYDEMIQQKQFEFLFHRDPSDIEKYSWKGYGNVTNYWYIR